MNYIGNNRIQLTSITSSHVEMKISNHCFSSLYFLPFLSQMYLFLITYL